MGRGLSDLQQQILLLAYHNRLTENRGYGTKGLDLYFHEILAEYYHFPTRYNKLREIHPDGGHCSIGAQYFNRRRIGRERYNAAQAAASRAIRRLEDRNLVEYKAWAYHKGCGLNLTANGISMARKLMVSTASP
jgi:hypothetical protein